MAELSFLRLTVGVLFNIWDVNGTVACLSSSPFVIFLPHFYSLINAFLVHKRVDNKEDFTRGWLCEFNNLR